MPLNIPIPVQTPPLPAFTSQASLDGATYTLAFQWNERFSQWYLAIFDSTGQTQLMQAVVATANWPLYSPMTVRYPPGALMFVDTSSSGTNPGLGDLGNRVTLLYLTAADLAALRAGASIESLSSAAA